MRCRTWRALRAPNSSRAGRMRRCCCAPPRCQTNAFCTAIRQPCASTMAGAAWLFIVKLLCSPSYTPCTRLLAPNASPCWVLPRRRIEFETDLFKGCAVVVWVLGVPSAPSDLFEGQRRKTAITVQGRFKRELSAEEVVTGQEFGRQPKNLPAKWLVETVLVKVRRLLHNPSCVLPLKCTSHAYDLQFMEIIVS